jgi:hypothetical protein
MKIVAKTRGVGLSFSSTEGGDYEVSVYVASDGGSSGSGSASVTVSWTDLYGSQSKTITLAVGSSGPYADGVTFPVSIVPSSGISSSASTGSLPPGAHFFYTTNVKDL